MRRLSRGMSRWMNKETGKSQGSWLPGSFPSGDLPHCQSPRLISVLSHLTSSQPMSQTEAGERGKEAKDSLKKNLSVLLSWSLRLHVLIDVSTWLRIHILLPGCVGDDDTPSWSQTLTFLSVCPGGAGGRTLQGCPPEGRQSWP